MWNIAVKWQPVVGVVVVGIGHQSGIQKAWLRNDIDVSQLVALVYQDKICKGYQSGIHTCIYIRQSAKALSLQINWRAQVQEYLGYGEECMVVGSNSSLWVFMRMFKYEFRHSLNSISLCDSQNQKNSWLRQRLVQSQSVENCLYTCFCKQSMTLI